MHNVTKGGTSCEIRTPWALIVVVLVMTIFGLFWYIERTTTPEPFVVPIDTSVSKSKVQPDPLDSLEQELSLIEIPDYASLF